MAVFDKEQMVSAREAVDILRVQKHDFLNYMQIVSGYLQIGNPEKAMHYVRKATDELYRSGAIMGLAYPALSIKLLLRVHNAYKRGVKILLSTSTDLGLLEPDREMSKFLENLFSVIEEVYCLKSEALEIGIDFSERQGEYLMTVNAPLLCEKEFSLLSKMVEERAQVCPRVTVIPLEEEGVKQLQAFFPKSTRSGQNVL